MGEDEHETDGANFLAARKPGIWYVSSECLGRPERKIKREQDESGKCQTLVEDIEREILKARISEHVIAKNRVHQRKQKYADNDLHGFFRHRFISPSQLRHNPFDVEIYLVGTLTLVPLRLLKPS